MQARSALFDLYGDHLRPRGGRAAIAALVRLLAPLGITAPAVRTAVSRMVRQGWLQPLRLATGPGYLLTARATRRLDDAAVRIYRTAPEPWSTAFDLVVLDLPGSRTERGRVVASLAFLGYGRLGESTWLSPRPADELATLLDESGLRYERFSASHSGGIKGAVALVERAWDLAAIGGAYRDFVVEQRARLATWSPDVGDEPSYAARFQLVHGWRSFLFRDPQLPVELLPADWPGWGAAAFFDQWAVRLRPAADRYVDRCLDLAGRGTATRFGPAQPERAPLHTGEVRRDDRLVADRAGRRGDDAHPQPA